MITLISSGSDDSRYLSPTPLGSAGNATASLSLSSSGVSSHSSLCSSSDISSGFSLHFSHTTSFHRYRVPTRSKGWRRFSSKENPVPRSSIEAKHEKMAAAKVYFYEFLAHPSSVDQELEALGCLGEVLIKILEIVGVSPNGGDQLRWLLREYPLISTETLFLRFWIFYIKSLLYLSHSSNSRICSRSSLIEEKYIVSILKQNTFVNDKVLCCSRDLFIQPQGNSSNQAKNLDAV